MLFHFASSPPPSPVRPAIVGSGSHPTEMVVMRGKGISLECAVQGVPPPVVTWMKDGRPLTKGRGVEVLDAGRTLQLKDAHVSDTGRYVCVATNVAGMADRKYDLSVHGKSEVTQEGYFLLIKTASFAYGWAISEAPPVACITALSMSWIFFQERTQ